MVFLLAFTGLTRPPAYMCNGQVLDLRDNPIGSSPEIMKFCLLCCPNLKVFNGQNVTRPPSLGRRRDYVGMQVTDEDVIAASEWGSGNPRGRSVYCLIEVFQAPEDLYD